MEDHHQKKDVAFNSDKRVDCAGDSFSPDMTSSISDLDNFNSAKSVNTYENSSEEYFPGKVKGKETDNGGSMLTVKDTTDKDNAVNNDTGSKHESIRTDNRGKTSDGKKTVNLVAPDDNPDSKATAASNNLNVPVSLTWKVPDGGWGWVVVVSALVISLIVDGLTYTFGIFLGEFERAFKQPKSTISLASSLQVGLYLFIGPVVSALTNRFGCRPVIITGSFVSAFAFVASSWSTNVTMLIMTYGVIGGIGFGLMYLPAIVAVSFYFEDRRALATGIAVCGSGIGTFILAPLTDYLLFEYNWNWTLFLLGGLILNGVVFGALVRPLQMKHEVINGSKAKAGYSIQNGNEDTVYQTKLSPSKTTASPNGLPSPEEVPLLPAIEENKIDMDSLLQTVEVTKPANQAHLFFNSTPNMGNISKQRHSLATVGATPRKNTSSEMVSTESFTRPRSNTLGMVRAAELSSERAARVRAHAPMGLAFISMSDADLNKIREDVHRPLSRKDIHLSGPLAMMDGDMKFTREDKGRGTVQDVNRSVISLSGKERHKEATAKPRGLWSCLPSSARDTLEEMLSLSILKDKRYWFVLMGNFFCMIGFYVPFVYVPDRAKQLGIEEDMAAFLLSIIAAYISLCSVLLCELLGVENLTNAFGFVILFRGVACIMGPPIAGAIIDATGVFDPSFYIGGGMIVLGAVSHAFLLFSCVRASKPEPDELDTA